MPILPNQGSVTGSTTVSITGINLDGATAVHFGDELAVITGNTPISVTVQSPPGNGSVQVTVTTNGGTSNPLNFFYIPYPIIISLSSTSGPTAGGNTITINGYNLSTASTLSFGANSATPTILSDSQISVVVPAGIGSVAVSLTTAGGSASGFSYTYYDSPTLDSLTPISGSVSGGISVTLTGTNLANTRSVTLDSLQAAFGVINNTTVAIITPSGTAGAVDVVITTTAGSATLAGGYTYVAQPGI
jgi:hypothetical protein